MWHSYGSKILWHSTEYITFSLAEANYCIRSLNQILGKCNKDFPWTFTLFYLLFLSILTLCWTQHPKTSAWGRGQNIPKRPVAIGKLRCFQTRKFPHNLARILWIITVRDFRYFLPRHLHCLCVQSESERVLKVESKKRIPCFRDGSIQRFRQWRTILWLSCWRCASRSCSRLGLRH